MSFEAHVEGWSFYCHREYDEYEGFAYYINAASSTCRKMTQVRQDTFEAAWTEVVSNIFEAPEGP
jgi:hypothetical protein